MKSSSSESYRQHTKIGYFVEFDPHDQSVPLKVGGIYVLCDISELPLCVGQGREQ